MLAFESETPESGEHQENANSRPARAKARFQKPRAYADGVLRMPNVPHAVNERASADAARLHAHVRARGCVRLSAAPTRQFRSA